MACNIPSAYTADAAGTKRDAPQLRILLDSGYCALSRARDKAHARRYYVRALTTDKELAQEGIERISELYKIDRELADLQPAVRSRERKRRMKGPLKRLRTWLAVTEAKVLPPPVGSTTSESRCWNPARIACSCNGHSVSNPQYR